MKTRTTSPPQHPRLGDRPGLLAARRHRLGRRLRRPAALDILHAAVDAGVNFLDTADVYGGGRSEKLIGRFLKQSPPAGTIFVATKLGRFPEPGGPTTTPLDAVPRAHRGVARSGSASSARPHAAPLHPRRSPPARRVVRLAPHAQAGGHDPPLRRQRRVDGRGARLPRSRRACASSRSSSTSSARSRSTSSSTSPPQKGVALIVRLPLASGLLAGKIHPDTTFPDNDHRNYNRDGQAFNVGETFAGIPFAKAVQLTDRLKPLLA